MDTCFNKNAFEDYTFFQKNDKKTVERINKLLKDIIVLGVCPKCVTTKGKRKQKKAVESRKWLARANSSAIEIRLALAAHGGKSCS